MLQLQLLELRFPFLRHWFTLIQGKSASIVLAGLMFATVLGLPITTVISQYFGWRISFGAVSVLVLVSAIMIQRLLPSSSNKEQLNWKDELLRFKNIHLWART